MKFRIRSAEFGVRSCFIILFLLSSHSLLVAAPEKWAGVDETVVERIAQEHGREAKEPLINTDQGDLLLFAFLIAGAAGGFGAGYYWRVLLERRTTSAPMAPERSRANRR